MPNSRKCLRAACVLMIALGLTSLARAEIVTISGSGVVGEWYRFDANGNRVYDAPEVLTSNFPAGVPFTASFTYDTDRVLAEHPWDATFTWYDGPITSYLVQTDAHTISIDHAYPYWGGGIVGVLNDHHVWNDAMYAAAGRATLFDGLPTLEGHDLNGSLIYLFDPTRTALTGTALPTRVCLAAFSELKFDFSALGYFLDSNGVPDRTGDSDNDGLSDETEISLGTNPCSLDTDGDGLPDATDPDPLVPETASESLARQARETSADVLALPDGVFAGPNPQAEAGRRNALSNRLQAAANALEAGDFAAALRILRQIRELLDGEPSPPDIIDEGPEKDALRARIDALIASVEAQLAD